MILAILTLQYEGMVKNVLREGDGEVEPLPQASEGDKRLPREAAGGHLTVGRLVLLWTPAQETTRGPVDTFPTVLTHTRNTPACGRIQFTVLAYKGKKRNLDF